MPKNTKNYRPILFTSAIAAIIGLSACAPGLGGFTSVRTQGYEISESALQQVRVGQSQDLVIAVMGSPQTQGNFGNESAFYYVETKIEQTTFGLKTVSERTVLAVYFDRNKRVSDKAVYTLQDGRLFAMETRRTASFGLDRTFVEQILASF
ncbi:MAG: outer membrane protein assembly factor BamE [Devosiaceae bacterium]|nr:outer membrane protein assembly factor BamE [Devosiaceae bacterium]